MSENQEHKTWIMLKRSVKFVSFSVHTEIIPKFTSSTDFGTQTMSNEYGEWTAYSDFSPKFWINTGTGYYSRNGSSSTLKMPKRVSMSFSRFRIKCSSIITTTVSGVNASTKQWETIASVRGNGDLQYTNVDGTKYYTEIKVVFSGHSNKYERGCFEIYNGKLRIN